MTMQAPSMAKEGRERLLPASALRVVRYGALEAGELFLWRMAGGVARLGIMVHDATDGKLRRFCVWFSDHAGRFSVPTYHLLDGGERPVVSLGKHYEFHIDPLDPRNRVVDQAWHADGPILMRIDDSVVLWAAPAPDTPGYRPELVRVHEGSFVPHEPSGAAAVFFAWQLRLLVDSDPKRYIVLGDCQAPVSK
jgi:hypothetical protein